jgi:hypothetical protein
LNNGKLKSVTFLAPLEIKNVFFKNERQKIKKKYDSMQLAS